MHLLRGKPSDALQTGIESREGLSATPGQFQADEEALGHGMRLTRHRAEAIAVIKRTQRKPARLLIGSILRYHLSLVSLLLPEKVFLGIEILLEGVVAWISGGLVPERVDIRL